MKQQTPPITIGAVGGWFDSNKAHQILWDFFRRIFILFRMSYCYILFSQKLDRFYIGVITQTPENWLEKHNQHSYGTNHFTAKANDWKEFLIIPCNCFSQALKVEKYVKKMKSKIYIQNLKKYPEMVGRILKLNIWSNRLPR